MRIRFFSVFMLLAVIVFSDAAQAESYIFKHNGENLSGAAIRAVRRDVPGGEINMYGFFNIGAIVLENEAGKKVAAFSLTPMHVEIQRKGKFEVHENDDMTAVLGGADNLRVLSNAVKLLQPKLNTSSSEYDARYYSVLQTIMFEVMYDGIDNFDLSKNGGRFGIDAAREGDKHSRQDNLDWMLSEINAVYKQASAADLNIGSDVEFFNITGGYPYPMIGFEITPAATPIPAAAWLLGSGVAGLALLRRKRSKNIVEQ